MTVDSKIRPAIASDVSAILKLVNQLHASISVTETKFLESFPSVLRDPNHCCLVIELDAEVVGFASGYMRLTLATSQPVAFLDEIVIKTELRGRRLGSRLMAAFEEWAVYHNCKFAALATGGARGFYEMLGYSSRAGYYKKPLNVNEK